MDGHTDRSSFVLFIKSKSDISSSTSSRSDDTEESGKQRATSVLKIDFCSKGEGINLKRWSLPTQRFPFSLNFTSHSIAIKSSTLNDRSRYFTEVLIARFSVSLRTVKRPCYNIKSPGNYSHLSIHNRVFFFMKTHTIL